MFHQTFCLSETEVEIQFLREANKSKFKWNTTNVLWKPVSYFVVYTRKSSLLFFLVLIFLFFLVLATFQSVKKKMISTMKNSCLPKLICELNASTNKDALTEGEKSLLKLIRWVGNKYNYLCIYLELHLEPNA